MQKPTITSGLNLPLELLGKDLESGQEIYEIKGLSADLKFSLDAAGYTRRNNVIVIDTVGNKKTVSGWAKRF